jgi:hypothetical protein
MSADSPWIPGESLECLMGTPDNFFTAAIDLEV